MFWLLLFYYLNTLKNEIKMICIIYILHIKKIKLLNKESFIIIFDINESLIISLIGK